MRWLLFVRYAQHVWTASAIHMPASYCDICVLIPILTICTVLRKVVWELCGILLELIQPKQVFNIHRCSSVAYCPNYVYRVPSHSVHFLLFWPKHVCLCFLNLLNMLYIGMGYLLSKSNLNRRWRGKKHITFTHPVVHKTVLCLFSVCIIFRVYGHILCYCLHPTGNWRKDTL